MAIGDSVLSQWFDFCGSDLGIMRTGFLYFLFVDNSPLAELCVAPGLILWGFWQVEDDPANPLISEMRFGRVPFFLSFTYSVFLSNFNGEQWFTTWVGNSIISSRNQV